MILHKNLRFHSALIEFLLESLSKVLHPLCLKVNPKTEEKGQVIIKMEYEFFMPNKQCIRINL